MSAYSEATDTERQAIERKMLWLCIRSVRKAVGKGWTKTQVREEAERLVQIALWKESRGETERSNAQVDTVQ